MRFVKPASLSGNSIILDIRTQEEYARTALKIPHIHKALSELNPAEFIAENHLDDKGQTINILCASGIRASKAAEMFEKIGFDNVAVIVGGLVEAEYAGLEIVRH